MRVIHGRDARATATIQIQVEFEHVYARLSEKSELPSFGMDFDELSDIVRV